jgi:SAM-dependent methyltransferase
MAKLADMATALYDTIGRGYASLRRPDARLEAAILEALGPGSTVVNVGAGAGSYEPRDRRVLSVEPSLVMLRQRDAGAAPALCATADALPFADRACDAALAVLTIHHWPEQARGLRELARIARERVVVLTWDPESPGFWLTDYFPDLLAIDRAIFPRIPELAAAIGASEIGASEIGASEIGASQVVELPIPHDCTDGFLGAYWRRPRAYLDERVRSAISTFAKRGDWGPGLRRLAADLDSGAWHTLYGEVLGLDALDLGYRLVIAHRERSEPREGDH